MCMYLLYAGVQSLACPVDVSLVQHEDVGALAAHGGAGLAVPLSLLPEGNGLLKALCGEGCIEVAVNGLTGEVFGVVPVVLTGVGGVIELVAGLGVGGAPCENQRLGVHTGGELVPAYALNHHLNAEVFEYLVADCHGDGLTDIIACGIQEGGGGLYAVLFADAVAVGIDPAGIGQELLSVFEVIFDLAFGIVPGHTVILGVCGNAVAVKSLVADSLTVNTICQSLADVDIGGEVVADRVAVLIVLGLSGDVGQCKTKVVNGLFLKQIVAGDGVIRSDNCGGQGDIDLTGLCCHKAGVGVSHLYKHDATDAGGCAVVVLVGLEDELLVNVVLNEAVGTGGDGICGKALAVCGLGNDADVADGEDKGGVGLVELDGDDVAVSGDALHAGEVGAAGVCLTGLKAEYHVLSSDGSTVGKECAVTEIEGVGQSIVGNVVVGGEVCNDLHLGVGLDKCCIEHLNAVGEAVECVKVGGNSVEADYDLVLVGGSLYAVFSRGGVIGGLGACAPGGGGGAVPAGSQREYGRDGKQECKDASQVFFQFDSSSLFNKYFMQYRRCEGGVRSISECSDIAYFGNKIPD